MALWLLRIMNACMNSGHLLGDSQGKEKKGPRCTRVDQLVEHLTLRFGSGYGATIVGSSPTLCSTLNMEPA